MTRIPFQERNSRWRGLLDLAAGRYPSFIFGGGTGSCLPVFHFHEVHPHAIEPYFQYIAENGYRTVDSDAIAAFALDRASSPPARTIALCFDDAWASLWVVVAPLLEKYDLRAITYVSPARVPEAASARPQADALPLEQMAGLDRSETAFATWPEIEAMHASGRVDVQAHAWRHAKIACDPTPLCFLRPGPVHPHEFPLIETTAGSRLMTPDDLGAPVYPTRSCLSDALGWLAPEAFAACTETVAAGGGQAFFDNPEWPQTLQQTLQHVPPGRWETETEQEIRVTEELARPRQILRDRLGGRSGDHMCFPWAIAGSRAVRIAHDVGYRTAFGDRLWGFRAVRAGDPAHQLMRLKHRFIFSLPGKGRSALFAKRPPDADTGLQLDVWRHTL